ncbi:MAG: hypothetical protein LBV73_31100 [Paraburkholderia sp.]|jgi:hypothetical protein|nr:hypothetical protein [Paraburkholderia sp.]
MNTFLGYFVWGLILAAPLWWLAWRLRLARFVPNWARPASARPLELPPQLGALVIRGKRRTDVVMRRPSAVPPAPASAANLAEPRS